MIGTKPVKRRQFQLPDISDGIFRPHRYKVFRGGRGSGKSWTVAGALVWLSARVRLRILCARELQISMADSVHKLISDEIERQGLLPYFKITATSIECMLTGSTFIFKGLKHNIAEIKSMEGIDICWVEEAQRVSQTSWETLIPTIRKEGSEIWITFNPDAEEDPTYQRFVVDPPPNSLVTEVNYVHNPFFPDTLRAEMEYMKRVDFEAYEHVWLGKPKGRSKAQILNGKYRVDVFDAPADAQFFYGADWGFAQDPTVLIRCYIKDRKLWIDYEAYGVGVELDEIPQLFDSVPGSRKWPIKADNARPETISHVANRGFPVRAADKWPGSIEDGITFLRSFDEIVIHERCTHTAEEARLYSYKVDKITEEVLPIVLDKHNHCMDAIRYALDQMIKVGATALLQVFAEDYRKERAAQADAARGLPGSATPQVASKVDLSLFG
jgi:phage terminase large subunit